VQKHQSFETTRTSARHFRRAERRRFAIRSKDQRVPQTLEGKWARLRAGNPRYYRRQQPTLENNRCPFTTFRSGALSGVRNLAKIGLSFRPAGDILIRSRPARPSL